MYQEEPCPVALQPFSADLLDKAGGIVHLALQFPLAPVFKCCVHAWQPLR